ncbi:MAG: cyclic nucleotide-binding domain-containing protein [Candidatus Tectomicrobia bacterium]|uniref:Cyclic nucleotide-binding domain-containing protein n=1 Tax=Tectimicrobiota bacterium TaxID=2528274 RepID=A0A932ZWV7_UNCTE|nr:cyclic nucleotide-binding domain-containing protein [Candidatus Tectomicrobia bacterium]MBI4252035.1 cyclic nucleotide-binding domain-containing protein [Candidatus Tectomicrobia bacterium]
MSQPSETPVQGGPVAQLVNWLQSTILFRGLDDAEVKLLLRRCGRMQAGMFDVICAENEPGETLFYILDGEVYLTRLVGSEEEFLALLGKGSCFGEAGLLGESMRTATARARQKTLLLTMEASLLHLLPKEISAKLMRNIALASNEKLKMANAIIGRLYEQLHSLQPRTEDWKESEERFIEKFGENPPV